MAKNSLVKLTVVGEKSAGILVQGEFAGVGELVEVDEMTAQNLIRRGRAKLYDAKQKGSKNKKDDPTE
ncbi:hypothetical protein [Halodesulfovibrio aestuarii]|uniref:hypothetical protein n=1 Tax=Halodesulfovibrio aestuarii TaxID=126333 RepID=UPI003D33626D